MSTVLEILPLEGTDIDGTPPCDALKPYPFPCGKPAAFRLNGTCTCGNHGLFFACRPCYEELAAGIGGCAGCYKQACVKVTVS